MDELGEKNSTLNKTSKKKSRRDGRGKKSRDKEDERKFTIRGTAWRLWTG
jgi:hypothetical protein